MENRNGSSSSYEERSSSRKSSTPKSSDGEPAKSKEKEKFKNSYIPVPKGEKTDAGSTKSQRKSSSSKITRPSSNQSQEKSSDLDEKLKLIEEKEKSVAEYYDKIDNLIKRHVSDQTDELVQNSPPRTEPDVNATEEKKDFLSDFEDYVRQISDVWLTASSSFSTAMKNLKNCCSVPPMELDIENVKIQLAIKQAKTLTLAKTRNVIAEVKKLLQHRETIRTELEKLLHNKELKFKCRSCGMLGQLGTGDACKENEFEDQETNPESVYSEKGETEGTDYSSRPGEYVSGGVKDSESCARELLKKNETITNLNCKIFKLQKTFNEQCMKYNELQVRLSECNEKIQWNQVLWKQIGKLKQQIKGLQHSNKQLECQKKELECRLARLDQEIDRLIKMNQVLNTKKYLMGTQDDWYRSEDESGRRSQERKPPDDKAVAEKQNAITQLKSILNIMTDQKHLAQQQINLYQSKIDELEKMLKRNEVS